MASKYEMGQRVEVSGKGIQGVIAYIGVTKFAQGQWIGLVLDGPKGKNNGSVQGEVYFQCEVNHGMFVRLNQVMRLDEKGNPIESPPRDESGKESGIAKLRNRPSTSKVSLVSSRQSLASSRQSLTGSRQSLSGSRTHLVSPNVDKTGLHEPASQIPKRSSFVETNFVETLKPQFTPGQAINSTTATPINSTIEDKLNNLQHQQELENRTLQIRDLTEKLETLKMRREDDRDKLKDHDKLKMQLEHLLEFKAKIMESQASLQRDLQRARQDAKEAIEAREAHAEEMADMAEAVEMATLDREMAEEKAETLQLELEVARERLEEVTLDLEILKTEMQQKMASLVEGGGTPIGENIGGGGISTYEMKQLEQQNARLRETLVRMRDMSAHEKHEHQKLLKDMDQKKSEIAELARTKEKLSSRIDSMEHQLADLQEQVDAALGAEEMVVILGEQKLTLEERVTALLEEVAELEQLQDMNDQLVESNAELELDLREELDLAHAATREALREKEAALETIADRESTIVKFREVVQKLQEQSLSLQQRLEKESSKSGAATVLPEIIDFKKMFSETKAHTKAIDLELRRVDVEQLQQHIGLLKAFMPDTFLNRGGDYDALLVLLLVPRLIYKTDILLGQIRDKFPAVEKIDRQTIIKGHSIEQYAFRCRLSYYINAVQAILHQFQHALNACKTEALLKVGSNYPEMSAQEKVIDRFVDLVKRDQLDENVPLEALEKFVGYFNTMFPVLFGIENIQNHTQLLNDNVKSLANACDAINNDAFVIRNLIESANIGDIALLTQHIISTVDLLHQQLKLVKRRLPTDSNIVNLGLNKEVFENMYQCYQHAGKILKTVQDIVKTSVHAITNSGDSEKGLSQEKIKDLAINASDKIYEQDDLGPVQSIKNSLNFILTQITQVAQFLHDNEYEITTANKNEEKTVPPIQIRAKAVRQELEQTKTLTSKLENKESDIKELRKTIKEKQEHLSEMTIRKELAEKKLGNVNKDYELTIEKLQRKLDELQHQFKKKEKEYEDTLDHLQVDIDSLEHEKGEMREKLKQYNRKSNVDVSKSTSGSQLSSMTTSGNGPNLPIAVRDSPLLMQEIENLQSLFMKERDSRLNLQNVELKKQLDSLKPLPTFKTTQDAGLDKLYKEGAALKQEILITLASPQFPSIYKLKPGNGPAAWQKHFAEQNAKILLLKRKAEEFQTRVAHVAVQRKYGGFIETDFTIFPTVEMSKVLNVSHTANIGTVKIPQKYCEKDVSGIIKLQLDHEDLQKLLSTFSG